jgi:alkylation response protein AidB-like acyl-CoA dehydrogenase
MDASARLDFTPAVGDHAFTAQQRVLLALANRLGRERFAPRAARWDEEASFPFANYDDLREHGLLKICWPTASR